MIVPELPTAGVVHEAVGKGAGEVCVSDSKVSVDGSVSVIGGAVALLGPLFVAVRK